LAELSGAKQSTGLFFNARPSNAGSLYFFGFFLIKKFFFFISE